MKRRGGLIGQTVSFFTLVIFLGLLVAALRMFNWDVIEAGGFVISKVFEVIANISDKFLSMPGFRQMLSS